MQPTPEIPGISVFTQINDMSNNLIRLRQTVETAEGIRFCLLILVLITYFVCIFAFGHSNPDFFRFGGVSVGIALIWAFKAIGDVFVSRQQIKLALAILAYRSLTERVHDFNEKSGLSETRFG